MSDLSVEPFADRLRAVYDRLWIDCESITQQDAETILEAVNKAREWQKHRCHHALDEALNSGDGSYRP